MAKKGVGRDTKLTAKWGKQVRDWEKSGQSVRAFCQERGLSEASMHRWKRELGLRKRERAAADLSKMATVQIEPEGDSRIEVELSEGRCIRVRPGFDQETLKQVVAVLEGQGC